MSRTVSLDLVAADGRERTVTTAVVHAAGQVGRLWSSDTHLPSESVVAKLRGFAVDSGIGRDKPWVMDLVSRPSLQSPLCPYPRWIEDDAWEIRAETLRPYVRSRDDVAAPWLGTVEGLQVQRHDAQEHTATWRRGRFDRTGDAWPERGTDLLSMADKICAEELLLPASARAAWEASAENIQRGEWLVPTAEEVEVYRLLGQPMPFLWGYDPFEAWLLERGAID